jgi:hypothetical protein
MKEDRLGRTYSTHGGDEKCVQNFYPVNQRGRDHMRHLTIDERKLKCSVVQGRL